MVVHFQGLPVTYLTRAHEEPNANSNQTIPKVAPHHSRFLKFVLQLRFPCAFPSIQFPWKLLKLENRKHQTFSQDFTCSLVPLGSELQREHSLLWNFLLPLFLVGIKKC